MRDMVPLFEGFLTYGGMSVREIEAMAVGLRETLDMDMISQSPQFIKYLVDQLEAGGVPVVTPAGGLGCHLDAKQFLPHVPQLEYSAGALAAALYIVSGIRGMERGTISMDRDADGNDVPSEVELLRLAMPRRVYTRPCREGRIRGDRARNSGGHGCEDGRRVAKLPQRRTVPRHPGEGDRTGLHREVLGSQGSRRLPLRLLRAGAVRVGHEVRIGIRLAQLLAARRSLPGLNGG